MRDHKANYWPIVVYGGLDSGTVRRIVIAMCMLFQLTAAFHTVSVIGDRYLKIPPKKFNLVQQKFEEHNRPGSQSVLLRGSISARQTVKDRGNAGPLPPVA